MTSKTIDKDNVNVTDKKALKFFQDALSNKSDSDYQFSIYNKMKKMVEKYSNDSTLMLLAVKFHGRNFELISDSLKGNKEIALAAVVNHGYALKWVDAVLQDDAEVVRAAVLNYGGALSDASHRLRADEDIVQTALTSGDRAHHAIRYAEGKAVDNGLIMLRALDLIASALRYASDRLLSDVEFIKEAYALDPIGTLAYADLSLITREMVSSVMKGRKFIPISKTPLMKQLVDELQKYGQILDMSDGDIICIKKKFSLRCFGKIDRSPNQKGMESRAYVFHYFYDDEDLLFFFAVSQNSVEKEEFSEVAFIDSRCSDVETIEESQLLSDHEFSKIQRSLLFAGALLLKVSGTTQAIR